MVIVGRVRADMLVEVLGNRRVVTAPILVGVLVRPAEAAGAHRHAVEVVPEQRRVALPLAGVSLLGPKSHVFFECGKELVAMVRLRNDDPHFRERRLIFGQGQGGSE